MNIITQEARKRQVVLKLSLVPTKQFRKIILDKLWNFMYNDL